MRKLIILLILLISIPLSAATYYVATTGNDSNAGTIGSPWASWEKAFSTVVAGDTVYIRGGTYTPLVYGWDHYIYNHDGTAVNQICVFNYPSEQPVLDCYTASPSGNQLGVGLYSCEYWHLKGLEVKRVMQDGSNYAIPFYFSHCSNITIENCKAHDSQGNGFDVYLPDGDFTFINCDSYNNFDVGSGGNAANGFATNGTIEAMTMTYRGCRSWYNSDDGFDVMSQEAICVFDSCWAWNMGRGASGNGMGFKFGNIPVPGLDEPQRIITNCISYNNSDYGYDRNEGNMEFVYYNNIAYHNLYGFVTTGVASPLPTTLKNNISYGNTNGDAFVSGETGDHNSWNGGVTVSNADFVSLDSTGISGARQANGTLPDLNFLKLASTSDMIDAGVNVGIAYEGTAPDMGPYEYIPQNPAVTPVVIITVSVAAGTVSATSGGNVTDDGGGTVSARGVAYGTSANPTISGTHTHDGTGSGIYVSLMTPLEPATTYHVRAYATNEAGTGYGADIEFTTLSESGLSGAPVFKDGKVLVKNVGGVLKVVIK